MSSSGVVPRAISGSAAPNSSCVSLSKRGKSSSGKPEDREDDVERVVHGDVADEVAFAAEVGHAVDVALRELGDAVVEARQRLRQEPVGRDVAIDRMIRRIHVDQRAQHVAGDGPLVVAVLRCRAADAER